jgi:hypothetical protein
VYRPACFYKRNIALALTAPKKNAEFLQVAILFFQRYKFIFYKIAASSVHLIKFISKDSFVLFNSALSLAANR